MIEKNLIKIIVFLDIIIYSSYFLCILIFGFYYEGKISIVTMLDYLGLTGYFTILIFLILLMIYIKFQERR